MDPQCSHWTCSDKSPTSSQETNLNLHQSLLNTPSTLSVEVQHQHRQEKTLPNSKKSLQPKSLGSASSYPSRRQDSSAPACRAGHQYPNPDGYTRPANVLSKDPLQDAIDAAYFRYLLIPDHTSIEAWVHDTIIAQFPDSSPSTKTLPLCGGDTKPSLHYNQQQSFLSTLVHPQSPSLQAHQNVNQPLTNISPNPQKRKQAVHHRVEDVPPFVEDLHRGWKQQASTCLNYPLTSRISQCTAPDAKFTYPSDLNHSLSTFGTQLSPPPARTTITSTTVPSLIKPPSQPLILAPQSRLTRSTAAKRRNTTEERVARSTAPKNHPPPTSLQPIRLQPRIAKSTKAKRWTIMNLKKGRSRGAGKDSKEAAKSSTIDNQGEEDILQGRRNRLRPRNQGSAPLQGLGSPNFQPIDRWPSSSLPERTIDASLQEHHLSPSQRGGPGQSNGDFNHKPSSGQDKPDMMYSSWTLHLKTVDEFSLSDPLAPTPATPICARGQQITFVRAGQFTPGEESILNERTQRQLFPSHQSANSSPQKKPTAPQMGLNTNMKGVPPSSTKKSQSSQGMPTTTPSGGSKAGSGKTFSQSITLDQIDMDYLAACEPSIEFVSPQQVTMNYKDQVPKMVREFMRHWGQIPRQFIPDQLKDYYEKKHKKFGDTPMTPRKEDLLKGYYAGFEQKQLENLAKVVSQVIERSNENHGKSTHERHWGASTVYTLLNEIVGWPNEADSMEKAYDIEAYNIENCAVEMGKYFIVRPGPDKKTMTRIEPKFSGGIKKMIDLSMALKLDGLDQAVTNDAFSSLSDLELAFNQTNCWYRRKPGFVDFEIKSEEPANTPLVQLAVWAGTLYLKRRHHNWRTDVPSLGVSVVGADWKLYITFEREPGKLVMMGPYKLGSTLDTIGAWAIVFKLNFIAHWGWTQFRPWFKDNIMNWCRWIAEQPLMDLHFIEQEKQEAAKAALIEQWTKSEGQ